jgi:transcriptional regulator with XRE-family HTH domain
MRNLNRDSFNFHLINYIVKTIFMPTKEKVKTIMESEAGFSASGPNSPPIEGWLRNIREAQGLSRRQIAEQLGVTVPAIQDYERSEAAGKITLSTLRKYAQILNCEVTVTLTPRSSASTQETRKSLAPLKRKPRSASAASAKNSHTENEENSVFNERMGLWSAQ